MTETPTPDEIAEWTTRHQPREIGPGWYACASCGTGTNPWPCPPARLIALVAAQALELRVAADNTPSARRSADHWCERALTAEAELSVFRATDEYQRWAQAVTWRDAVKRVQALCDEADAKSISWSALITTRSVRAALAGDTANRPPQ